MPEDGIEREVVIDAPPEVVWDVVTRPEHIKRWFSPEVELDLREGGKGVFFFPDGCHTITASVVRVDKPRAFAWRWLRPSATNPAELTSTLVEFTLAEEDGGTRLVVAETGFRTVELAADDAAALYAEHERGWAHHLGLLAGLFADREAVS
jgi:uncharacterized protein YndB with AHSA1/START domain